MKRAVQEIVDFYEVMEMRKASCHVLIPQDTLNWLIKRLYPKGGNSLKTVWLDAGRWFGKFLATKLHSHKAVAFFVKILTASEWELDEVSLEKKENILRLRLVSFTLPLENTELLMSYVEGVMQSLGYETENREHMRSMITIDFRKQ